jgi:hypothetical protein
MDDVQRQGVDVDACATRHGTSLAEIEPGPFSPVAEILQRPRSKIASYSSEKHMELSIATTKRVPNSLCL